MTPDPDRSYSTSGGTRLRWGTGLEIVGDQLVLHCTDRNFGKSCDINTFTSARRSGSSRRQTVGWGTHAKQEDRRQEGRGKESGQASPQGKAIVDG